MKANIKNIILIVAIFAIIIVSVAIFTSALKKEEQFLYSDLVELFNNDLVTSFDVDGNLKMSVVALVIARDENGDPKLDTEGNFIYEIDTETGKNKTETHTFNLSYNFQLDQINQLALRNYEGIDENGKVYKNLETYNYQVPAETPWYQLYLPYLILPVIFIVFYFFMMRGMGGTGKINSFAKSKAKLSGEHNTVKFADVAGADEEKAELEEVVEFLKDPSKYVKLGARIPRGVLLVGPPGTGKTLLAKAVAGEAGVPFFSISGSDFVELYVGVGASRVRDLFDNARRTPASIIFIDEIDAVGRHRGAGLGGGHDEREQTLNQLLVEMDGFGTNSGVIVIAATKPPRYT